MEGETFAVIGGDKRCAYVAQLLIKERKTVKTVGLELSGIADAAHICTLNEALATSDYIILPLPLLDTTGRLLAKFTSERLDVYSIISRANREAVLFAGMIPPSVFEHAERQHKELYDYYQREELQRMNAVPTAEGALEILMNRLPQTIFGSSILVIGFGRTAQSVAVVLRAVGADVCVCARKPEALAHAITLGMRALPAERLGNEKHSQYDAVVNTVPARIVTAQVLSRLRSDCFVLDLASAPGGTDFEYAKRNGFDTELALSLPGRVAPKTAGGIIKDTVLNMIEERGHQL
ncbi:MAG: dipicolinate synthase subunit DpsA [Oscillospiraceae bacterium]